MHLRLTKMEAAPSSYRLTADLGCEAGTRFHGGILTDSHECFVMTTEIDGTIQFWRLTQHAEHTA